MALPYWQIVNSVGPKVYGGCVLILRDDDAAERAPAAAE
jgi:hypothetical protein